MLDRNRGFYPSRVKSGVECWCCASSQIKNSDVSTYGLSKSPRLSNKTKQTMWMWLLRPNILDSDPNYDPNSNPKNYAEIFQGSKQRWSMQAWCPALSCYKFQFFWWSVIMKILTETRPKCQNIGIKRMDKDTFWLPWKLVCWNIVGSCDNESLLLTKSG